MAFVLIKSCFIYLDSTRGTELRAPNLHLTNMEQH